MLLTNCSQERTSPTYTSHSVRLIIKICSRKLSEVLTAKLTMTSTEFQVFQVGNN